MNRLPDESYLSFSKRLIEAKKDNLISYQELGDGLLQDENVYSDDNIRKFYYIYDKMLRRLDDIGTTDIDAQLKAYEKIKEDIFKERRKLQDERRLKNKDLTEEARLEKILDNLVDAVSLLEPIKLNSCERKVQGNVEASLLLSDIHLGLVVNNVVNYYDIEVCKERMSELLSKTIRYCKLHQVTKLNIELLGDLINGVIKLQNRIDEEEDTISQIVTISEILSQFINGIKAEVPSVVIYGVIGNHSAVFANKNDRSNKENFERLIYKFISLRTGQKVITNGLEDFLTYKVGDKEIVLAHGNADNITNAKQHFVDLLGRTVDFIHLGHVHHFNVKDDNNTTIIVNGSTVGTDSYATQIRKNTDPSQTLVIYDEDVCIYKISLT